MKNNKQYIPIWSAAVAVALLLAACTEEKGTIQPPGPDTTPDAHFGLPNWDDPEHDWIAERDSVCRQFDLFRYSWEPQFSFTVFDAAPDGSQLVMKVPGGLALLDTRTGTSRRILNGNFSDADWSSDGSKIAAFRDEPIPLKEKLVIYDIANHSDRTVLVPDNVEWIGGGIQWDATNNNIITGLLLQGEAQSHAYSISTTPPYSFIPFLYPESGILTLHKNAAYTLYQTDFDNKGRYGNIQLKVGPIADTINWSGFPVNGLAQFSGPGRIAPNGEWIAFNARVITDGSRFDFDDSEAPALVVFDLRDGSPSQYQIYRVFVDYTLARRNCSKHWFSSGFAWSEDGTSLFHEQIRRTDSTMQIVRRNVRTGVSEEITDFHTVP